MKRDATAPSTPLRLPLLSILATVLITSVYAAPGDLDTTFGNGGTVATSINGGGWAWSLALQTDGKIVVAGSAPSATTSGGSDYALARYNANGSLDSGFGVGGVVTTPMGDEEDDGRAVAVQSDGKIVFAGDFYSRNLFRWIFGLVRYNPNGSLDNSFGAGGKVSTQIGTGSDDFCYGIALQSDGKLIVTGSSSTAGQISWALVRYNSNGSLDSSFGAGGKVLTTMGGGIAKTVAVQNDGKIVAAGSSTTGNKGSFAVARYLSDGSLDASFGSGGKVSTSIGAVSDYAFSLALQSDGKIVVAGRSGQVGYSALGLVRYNSDGSLDGGFGTNGKLIAPFSISGDPGTISVAVQRDGKILVASDSYQGSSNRHLLVARYSNNGILDGAFGVGGVVAGTLWNGESRSCGIAARPDGTIVVAGYFDNPQRNFALAGFFGAVEPLVFIPGIAGSELRLNGTQLWPTVKSADLANLNLRTGAVGIIATDIIRTATVSLYPTGQKSKILYQPLVDHFTAQGYIAFPLGGSPANMTTNFPTIAQAQQTKPTFFPFPYDWRYSNSTQTALLHQYISNIRQLHGGAKVNIVAHSMGGLIARRYMLDYGANDIDHLVTVGSPLWGAPKAIYQRLNGGFFEDVLFGSLIEAFDRTAEIDAFSSFSSIYELMPSDAYLQNGGSPVLSDGNVDYNNNGIAPETYTPAQVKALLDPSNINGSFHGWNGGAQDDWSADTSGVKFLHICGIQNINKTTVGVVVRSELVDTANGLSDFNLGPSLITKFDQIPGAGDKTVPLLSSQRLSQFWAPGTQVRPISGGDDVEHTALIGNPTALSMIDAFLANQTVPPAGASGLAAAKSLSRFAPSGIRERSRRDATPAPVAKALSRGAVASQSPIGTVTTQRITISGSSYVRVVDSLGNDNAKISDMAAKAIPGVSISYGGGEPWMDITANSTVDLTIQGAASSLPIEVKVLQLAQDGSGLSLRRYRFNPVSHAWQGHIAPNTIPSGTDPVVSVDTNNNGTYEAGEQIPPSLTSGSGAVDTTPPSLGMTLTKSGDAIFVGLSATDNMSPNPAIRYTINDGPVQTYTGPLSVTSGQDAVIKAFAEDAMGNGSGLITTSVRPALSVINQARIAIGLSWPIADAYVLEETTDLSLPWSKSPVQITKTGFTQSAVFPIGNTNKKFFRLRAQTVTK